MKKTTTIALFAITMALAGTAAAGNKSGQKFRATLSGSNEVDPVATEASGDFRLAYDDFEGTATYRIRLNEAFRVFQAHIHCAPEGSNGPVAVWLAGAPAVPRAWDVDGKWIDNASVTDEDVIPTACGSTLAELIDAIHDGEAYVNVHTRKHMSGELRGQIEAK